MVGHSPVFIVYVHEINYLILPISQLRSLVVKYRTDMSTELQQRAVEYTQLWTLDRIERLALLERVPVLESAEREEKLKGTGGEGEPYLDTSYLADI